MTSLDVDTEKLGKSGEDMGDVAEKIKLLRDDYLDKITSYHGCWGEGEFGEKFGEKYLQGVDAARTGVRELADALFGSSQSLKDAAKDFDSQQQHIAEALNVHGGRR
ncbi:type VII secretion target [Streptomyces sp. NPDC019224]|uniref:WXG100 family type VII secretion target n=1 Tax=Streptomyces sp. NPDC019224 TaxID=3154484 RepID=UPI0033EFEBB1